MFGLDIFRLLSLVHMVRHVLVRPRCDKNSRISKNLHCLFYCLATEQSMIEQEVVFQAIPKEG